MYVGLNGTEYIVENMLVTYHAKRLYSEFRCEVVINVQEKGKIRNKVAGLVVQKIGGIVLASVDTIKSVKNARS